MSKAAVFVLISGLLLGGVYFTALTSAPHRSPALNQPEAVADTIPFEYVAVASHGSHH